MKQVETPDEFELQLRRERAERRRRTTRIMAWIAKVALVISTSAVYFSGAYQGLALDPRPCAPAEVEGLARNGWTLDTVTVDGAVLSGVERLPEDPDAPWVLYFGGNVAHSLRTARAYAELLLGHGKEYGVASFAYRGFDTSTGETKPSLLGADARAVFDHLVAKHGVRAERLHVIGFSLGANAAALLGKDLASTEYRLGSTTLISPGIAPHQLPPRLHPLVIGAYEMPSKLQAMRGPVLLISANDDPTYPPALHARKMPALLGARLAQHVEVSGGDDGALRGEQSLAAVRQLIGLPPTAAPEKPAKR